MPYKRYERPDGEGCFLALVDSCLVIVALAILIGAFIGGIIASNL